MFTKLIAFLILGAPILGYAEQRLMVREGGNVTANISATSLNKISVQGDRISMVKGNAGQFQLEKDLTLGQIFIQPIMPEDKSPMHVYLTTEKGRTYSLTLLSTDMPAENIILVSTQNKAEAATWDASSSYEGMIVKIIKAMHNQIPLDGFMDSEPSENKRNYKIKNLMIKNQGNYIGQKLQGHRYQVQNISDNEITLKESDFYHHDVRAISILNKRLAPKGTTILYTVRGVTHD